MLDWLETNKLTVVEEVEDHVVVAIVGSDMVGVVVVVVVTVVLGNKAVEAVDITRGFSMNLTLYCLFNCLLTPTSLFGSLAILFLKTCNF